MLRSDSTTVKSHLINFHNLPLYKGDVTRTRLRLETVGP